VLNEENIEIETNVDARAKANKDYNDSTKSIPKDVRKETTFVFVTPISGRRDWPDTWKNDGISAWVAKKRKLGNWKDVRVLDGCQLIDWTCQFPAIGHWLGTLLGQTPDDYDTAYNYWNLLSSYGEPPSLLPDLFTIGLKLASDKLRRLIIERNDTQLRLVTRYPGYSKSFVCAFLASLSDDERADHQNKVLVFKSPDSFKQACSLSESHVFVLDFDLDANSKLAGGTQ